MTDDELQRYARHLLLDDLGVDGQERLLRSHALVIGLGGLGSPAAMYLATAGVGRLTLVDPDGVDLTNLQRQIAHTQDRLGEPKVESAARTLRALNPGVQLTLQACRADTDRLDQWVPGADVVLDCSDNFATRQQVNAACVRHGVPLVSGAALGFDAQVSVFDPRRADAPCYACVYPPEATVQEASCATMGVFAPLVGIIGATQAAEALKLLAGVGTSLAARLLMLDARHMQWSELRVPRRADCPICGSRRAGDCSP